VKKYVNHIFTFSGYAFVAIPLFFITVAVYSYYSILNTFGQVPPYEDGIYSLQKIKGVRTAIFQ
jgi:hypothetical protein